MLQVVQGTYSTQNTVASTSYADTGLSLAITPTAATSKILILIQQNLFIARLTNTVGGALKVLRGGTDIYDPSGNGPYGPALLSQDATDTNSELQLFVPIMYLDSPNTTSSTTYKTQQRAYLTTNTGTSITQFNGATSSITLMEIGA